MATWRFRASANCPNFEIVSITFKETENGDVTLQEETIVLHSWYLPTLRPRDAEDEKSIQDEACDDDDGVAGEKKNIGEDNIWEELIDRLNHLPKKKKKTKRWSKNSCFEYLRIRPIDQHSVKTIQGPNIGGHAHYVMVAKIQRKPFWLAIQLRGGSRISV